MKSYLSMESWSKVKKLASNPLYTRQQVKPAVFHSFILLFATCRRWISQQKIISYYKFINSNIMLGHIGTYLCSWFTPPSKPSNPTFLSCTEQRHTTKQHFLFVEKLKEWYTLLRINKFLFPQGFRINKLFNLWVVVIIFF